MTDLPSSESRAATGAPVHDEYIVPGPTGGRGSRMRADRGLRGVYLSLAALGLLLLAQWWFSQSQLTALRDEVAQRLRNSDSQTAETRVLVKSMQDSVKELQGKFGALEGKQTEAQSQQLALEQLYQDLSKNRDDWALAEIEQVLSTASQQLQLAGNVQGALIALQNADNRLALSDKPQFVTIRRALAKDLDRLRSLPSIDLTGIALRLDSLIEQIDIMPMLSDERPAQTPAQPKNVRRAPADRNAAGAPASASTGFMGEWLAPLNEKWSRWSAGMWSEISQLVRVRNVETPDALLLSPTQAYYARENLKLRLLNARLALLGRNEAAFRGDLTAAQDTINKYFDTRAKQTQAVQSQLRHVQATNLSIEMPTLAESLNAVRNYKANP
jgi:uroporphyrin-3 C-methyltransferase/uroporphyrinogen III methyltransferase/synthase